MGQRRLVVYALLGVDDADARSPDERLHDPGRINTPGPQGAHALARMFARICALNASKGEN
jgi:hypothetical protein